MKKLTILCMCALMFTLTACKKDDIEEAKTEIQKNDIYEVPTRPTEYQAITYNELTNALSGSNEQQIVELVAKNFATDFFTLKNKENAESVGGLTYLPYAQQEEFQIFALNYVYSNYQLFKDDYGKASLPVVEEVKVITTTPTTISYTKRYLSEDDDNFDKIDEEEAVGVEQEYDGYEVKVEIVYESTKIEDSKLKTTATFHIIKTDNRYSIIQMD